MTVHDFDTGARFVIRVFKNHFDNPSDTWVNSYEFKANESGTEGVLIELGNEVVAFEKAMHGVKISFNRMTISTWEEDSVPYNPLAFISTTLTGVGAVGEVTGLEPLNECLSVSRVCASGRVGHIFFRGALDAAEVFSPGGRATLIDDTEIQGRIDDALTASGLGETLGVLSAGSFQMVLIDKPGTTVRNVVGLVAAGVSFLPLDHAWFNRTP